MAFGPIALAYALGATPITQAARAGLSPAGPAAASKPTVQLSPAVGPPTTSVTASGRRFAPNTSVAVTFDSALMGSATTDDAGTFSLDLIVPATADPGQHSVGSIDGRGLFGRAFFTVQTDWDGFGFDAARTGFNPFETVLTPETVPGLSEGFSTLTGGPVRSSPAIAANKIIFGSDDGSIRAADGTTGDTLWSFATGGPVVSSPAVDASCSTVVVGSDDGFVYALDCSGGLLWSFPTGGPVRSSPLIVTLPLRSAAQRAIVGSEDGSIYALDLSTGAPVWVMPTGGPVDSSPALMTNVGPGGITEIVVGSADGMARGLDAGSGALLWSMDVGGPVEGAPALVPGSGPDPCKAFVAVGVPVGGTTGSVKSLDCSTGEVLWTTDLDTVPVGSPALAPTGSGKPAKPRSRKPDRPRFASVFDVLVGGADGTLHALEGATGAEAWSAPLGGDTSSPAVADGMVFSSVASQPGTSNGGLQVRDVQSGDVLADIVLSDLNLSAPIAPPAVLNGTVTMGGGTGSIHLVLSGSWPQFMHDAQHTSNNLNEWQLLPSSSLKAKWTFQSGSPMNSPSVAGGIVYVGSSNHNVYALNAGTGAIKWAHGTGGDVDSTPAVDAGVAYVGSEDGVVYALDAKTGAVDWTHGTGGAIDSSPAVTGGVVYIGSGDRYVYALDTSDGSELWKTKLDAGMLFQSPVVSGGVVYIASDSFLGTLYALDASDGSTLWSEQVGGRISGSATVANGVLYVAAADNKLHAIQASDGTPLWTFATGGPNFGSPVFADGTVWFGSQDNSFYGVDTNGNQVYKVAHGAGPVMSAPSVAGHVVYYAFYGAMQPGGCSFGFPPPCWGPFFLSKLCWVSTAGGADNCVNFDQVLFHSVAVANGFVYLGTQGTKMLGLAG
jgi:outer membrane protein assembly factor BamB